ncbi:hypothetical protein Tco_1209293 [Tanacetum coccineum]
MASLIVQIWTRSGFDRDQRVPEDGTRPSINIGDRGGIPRLQGVILRTVYHDLYLGEKALVERENVGFVLTKSDIFPIFIEDLTAKGMGLRMADSHNGNHHKDGFTPLETIRRLLSIIWEKIPFELEWEVLRHQSSPSRLQT